MKNEKRQHKPGRRTSLKHVGGTVELAGPDKAGAELLRDALSVPPTETSALRDVHAFHTYPARMHPETAQRLVASLTRAGDVVMDPFSGGATVMVEARRGGRAARGFDVNPLSGELAWLKTLAPPDGFIDALATEAGRVAAHADERRRRRARATGRFHAADMAAFPPHVLMELDGLRDGIRRTADGEVRRALNLVLSALLTKVSSRTGDTARGTQAKQIAPGFPARFFVQKTTELGGLLRAYRNTLPSNAPAARFVLGDARVLPGMQDSCVQLVVTSPPYAGVYDYVDHHEDRLRWLGLPVQEFRELEMGSRRELGKVPVQVAVQRWEDDFGAAVRSMARVLVPGGRAVLLMADSTVGGRAVYVEDVVRVVAARAGLAVRARASQGRPHFHAGSRDAFQRRPRQEHLVMLGRD